MILYFFYKYKPSSKQQKEKLKLNIRYSQMAYRLVPRYGRKAAANTTHKHTHVKSTKQKKRRTFSLFIH